VIVLDTSFLAHALIPTQRTLEAVEALRSLKASSEEVVVPLHVVVEFGSLLRKVVNQRRIAQHEAQAAFREVMELGDTLSPSEETLLYGFELASRLEQSDTFDATGYALAEAVAGEFWTADRRFANAADTAGLTAHRLVP
jgi:predicted nucleic acid-binding protein